jgi:hypothetical protein
MALHIENTKNIQRKYYTKDNNISKSVYEHVFKLDKAVTPTQLQKIIDTHFVGKTGYKFSVSVKFAENNQYRSVKDQNFGDDSNVSIGLEADSDGRLRGGGISGFTLHST